MKKFVALACFAFAVVGAAAREIIVNATDIPPFCFEENGRPRGIAIDILDEAAKTAKIDFRYRFFPWLRAQLQTKTSSAEAIIPLTRLPQREQEYQWIAPLFTYHFVIVTRQAPPPRTLDEAKPLKVGVLRGNPMELQLPQMGFKDVRVGKSEDEMAKQLRVGLIDAWVVADLAARDTYQRAGGIPDELLFGARIGEPMWVYLAASPRFPMADHRRLADAIAYLKRNGVIDKIVAKYWPSP